MDEELLAALSHRCTQTAWEFLQELHGHSILPLLVSKLEQSSGAVDAETVLDTLVGLLDSSAL